MRESHPNIDVGELLAHSDWVTRIAHQLVGPGIAAEDAVQETWLEALQRPPRDRRNLRAWLGSVVANRVRQSGRGESRRKRRELAAARPESQPSMDDLEQRAAIQREVVGHVLDLDEPFRAVVLLRFFDDLTPPQIATRLGIPLKTVHSRQQRAFEKLRTRLDQEHGDRAGWSYTLAPLLTNRRVASALRNSTSLATLGGSIMGVKLGAALIVGVLGGITWWNLGLDDRPVPSAVRPDQAPPASAPLSEVSSLPDEPKLPERVAAPGLGPVATEVVASTESQPEPAPSVSVRGRVVDVLGTPIAGLPVGWMLTDDPTKVLTDADGGFEFPIPGYLRNGSSRVSEAYLSAHASEWMTLRQAHIRLANIHLEHLIVVAPVQTIGGHVEGVDGARIPGASVELSAQGSAYQHFPFPLDLTRGLELYRETDAVGSFEFERFPRSPGLRLRISASGHDARSVDLDSTSTPLVVQLIRTEESEAIFLEGIVVDPRGALIEGADVHLAGTQVKTDATGAFRLPLPRVAATTPLCAAKAGRLPALLPDFGAAIAEQDGRPAAVELVLGPEPVSIRGRVVDDVGTPCQGWKVSIADPTVISQYWIPVTSAEEFGLGRAQATTTDDTGRFQLDGLFPREYKIQAMDEEHLLRTHETVFGGETDVVLTASRATRAPVHGIVTDRRGDPVGQVEVTLSMRTFESDLGGTSAPGATVITGDDGRFRLDDVPAMGVYLHLHGAQVLPQSFDFPENGGDETLDIEVAHRCHVRIEYGEAPPTGATAEFIDNEGHSVQVNEFDAGGMRASSCMPVEAGASGVRSVSDAATTVIIKDGERELKRQAISLLPGDVNVLRL